MTQIGTTQGAVSRWKQRWFGHTSEAEREVKRLQRQGSSMAHIAHAVSTMMLLLISLATLITLGRSTGQAFLDSVQTGHPDWMKGLAIAILFFLVIGMDTAVLYGANTLRVLLGRRSNQKLLYAIHTTFVVGVAVLEGLTYWIMILTYEHPSNDIEYHIGQARAFGAPAIAIYLALATVISITKADILNVAAVQSGIVAVQQVSTLAGNPNTPLAQVWNIFDAASGGSHDDDRIQRMIVAVSWTPERDQKALPEPKYVDVATIQPLGVVKPSERKNYQDRIEQVLLLNPAARPGIIAAELGLTVPLVCQYLAERTTHHV